MTDPALQNAKARLEAITAQIADAESQISELRERIATSGIERDRLHQFIATWHELAGIPVPTDVIQPVENFLPAPHIKRVRPKNPDREIVVERVLEIIRECGKPMSRHALFEALVSRGVEIHGKDSEMVLSTMLWRSQDRIVRLGSYGYWPTELPYPAANYYPLADALFGIARNVPEDGAIAYDL